MPKSNKTKIAVKKEVVAPSKSAIKKLNKITTKNSKLRPIPTAKAPVKPRPSAKTLDQTEKQSGFVSFLIIAVVMAAAVGGGIYTWQQKVSENKVEAVKNESETLKVDFEKRLSNLKNKLSGFQVDKEKLKETQKELVFSSRQFSEKLKLYLTILKVASNSLVLLIIMIN